MALLPIAANAEGSIYQREDGRRVASVTVMRDGIRKCISRYADTMGVARKILTSIKKNQDDGRPVDFDKLSPRQCLDIWLEDFVKSNRSPRTFGEYHSLLRRVVPEDLGRLPLNQIRAEQLQKLFTGIAADGKGRTAEALRAVLRASFNRAIKLRKIALNPVAGTEPVRFIRNDGGALTNEQATSLLKTTREAGDRLEPLWTILIALGLRSGEAFGLKPEDVDIDNRGLDVKRALVRLKLPGEKEGHWIEAEPKSVRSRRSFRLPEIAFNAIVRQLAQREAEQIETGKAWQNAPYLFTTLLGGPLHARNVLSALHAACTLAKVPEVRIHDQRHTCGSFLNAQGVSLPLLVDVLGHSQVSTARCYIHTSDELRGVALDAVGKLLAPDKPSENLTESVEDKDGRKNRVAVTAAVN